MNFEHSLPAPNIKNSNAQEDYINHKTSNLNIIKKRIKEKSNRTRNSKKKKKQYQIGIRKDFPTLVEIYGGRKKKIKKRKKKSNKLISRFDIELINISEKIKQIISENKKYRGLKPTNKNYIQKRKIKNCKKKSKIKKCIETLSKIKTANTIAVSESEKKQNFEKLQPSVEYSEYKKRIKKQKNLKSRIKQIFNNTPEIRKTYDNQIVLREYITNTFENSLDYKILKFLNHLNFSQLLKKKTKPLKHKKRLISGFNEVFKSLQYKQRENLPLLVVVAVNVERNGLQGGTDWKLDRVLGKCRERGVVFVFSCSRRELGFALYGRRLRNQPRIAVVAVLDCHGFEGRFLEVLDCVKGNKKLYFQKFKEIKYFSDDNTYGN